MTAVQFYVFRRKGMGLKGEKLGVLLAPDKHTAEVSARVMYGGYVLVQSKADWEIEQGELSALKRRNRDGETDDGPWAA